MLGKNMLADLKALARNHGLATGSRTVPNSAGREGHHPGRSPPKAPTQRKKPVLKRPKRKAPKLSKRMRKRTTRSPRMASLQRGQGWHHLLHSPHPSSGFNTTVNTCPSSLIANATSSFATGPSSSIGHRATCSRGPGAKLRRGPPSASTPHISTRRGPPSNTSTAGIVPIGDEVAHTSPILITESPIASPRQATTENIVKEGGDENPQQAPRRLSKPQIFPSRLRGCGNLRSLNSKPLRRISHQS
ncbi:hypothetical protein ACSQ67_025462 [Phaseolus vulgaris]